MVITKKNKLATFLLIISFSLLYPCELNTFKIKEELFNENIVAYYLSAIDVNSGSSNVSLFQYSIESTDNDCYDLESNTALTLQFSMDIYSPEIGFNSSQNLFSGKIILSGIHSPIRVSNMDIDYSTTSIPGVNSFDLDYWEGVQFEDEIFELLKSSILSSGKIPNGLYSFNFKLLDEQGQLISNCEECELNRDIIINEPEYINLISPGGSVSDTSSNIVYSNFPVFTWNSDICSSCVTQIRVCEFNPNEHSSPSDAINDIANLPNGIGDDYYDISEELMNSNLNSFQYPTNNSKNLEAGKLYVWQLKRTYQSTLGIEEILSDIYIFKMFDAYNQALTNLETIKLLIGEEKYNQLFSQTGELSGYNQLEGNITLNGLEISIDDLNQIINQIQNGTITIQEIFVE